MGLTNIRHAGLGFQKNCWSSRKFEGVCFALACAFAFHTKPCQESDKLLLQTGNRTFLASLAILRCCLACNVPVAMENPATSLMWQLSDWHTLRVRQDFANLRLDMCAFGTPYQKATRVYTWMLTARLPSRAYLCGMKRGKRSQTPSAAKCGRSGQAHCQLTGACKKTGFKTKLAAMYPEGFAKAMLGLMFGPDLS